MAKTNVLGISEGRLAMRRVESIAVSDARAYASNIAAAIKTVHWKKIVRVQEMGEILDFGQFGVNLKHIAKYGKFSTRMSEDKLRRNLESAIRYGVVEEINGSYCITRLGIDLAGQNLYLTLPEPSSSSIRSHICQSNRTTRQLCYGTKKT